MTCENNHVHYDINNIVRSVAVALVALPVSFALAGQLCATTRITDATQDKTGDQLVVEEHKDALTKACIDFRLSKVDTKLEREAKTAIDEYFDGEVDYNSTCRWVLG